MQHYHHHAISLQMILALFYITTILMDNALVVIADNGESSSMSYKREGVEVGFTSTTTATTTTLWNKNDNDDDEQAVSVVVDLRRELQLTQQQNNGKCWSTRDDRKPNRYCLFDDTPRSGAFLSLSCPTSNAANNNLQHCQCTIGIGDSKDAPNTNTCWKCGFCRDGSLAYDCRNVAEGTCIGRNCLDDCLSSYSEPEDLLLGSNANTPTSGLLIPSIVIATVGVLLFHYY